MSTSQQSPDPTPDPSQERPEARDPAYKRTANWMPNVVVTFGLGGFVFELISAHAEPWKMAAALSLAVGVKGGDVIRKLFF